METIGICLRCGRQFEQEDCPVCDQVPEAQPKADPRAEAAWQELKNHGLPVPALPWISVADYYHWLADYHQTQRGVASLAHPPVALEERLRDLLRTLEEKTQSLLTEIEQGSGGPTLVAIWFAHQQFTQALSRRLGGNPRTLRRRLVAYKCQLTRQAHAAANTISADYPPEAKVPHARWERVRADAALREGMLTAFIGQLEVLIRPSLAQVQTTRTEQKRGEDDA